MSLKRLYILTTYGEASALVPHMDGVEVVMGQVQDLKDTLTKKEKHKPEDPEEKKRRLSVGDGFCKKITAEQLVKIVNSDPNPKEAFVFTDLNLAWKFAEQMKDSGVPGIYPTEADRLLEVDREGMKKIVEKEYPDLKVAEVEQFKKVDDAKKFLEDTEDVWCLKGYDIDAKTVVPDTDDPEKGKEQLDAALEAGKPAYEKSGFILERKIKNVIEITPEAFFFKGKMIAATIDIELKRQGAGDVGPMCGCAADLVFPIDLQSKILKMAFPKWVYDQAKKHDLFIFDASILFDPKSGDAYFGEVCSNRPGWNSVLTEMALSGGAVSFLEALQEGKSPFKGSDTFGASVRVFSPHKDTGNPKADLAINYDENPSIWLLDPKEDDGCVTAGYSADLAVMTGTGSTIRTAAHKAYTALMDLNFEGKMYRPEEDYMSEKYKSSIVNRFKYAKSKGLFILP